MFTLDLNQDTHRVFLTRINKRELKVTIKWKHNTSYCLEPSTYDDYSKIKDLQIQMDEEGYKNVPCV